VTAQGFPTTGREYRLSRHVLESGAVTVVVFGLIGIASVTAAILNFDDSFRHPLAAAVFFGAGWSCFVLLGVWQVLAYSHHRLYVDSKIVRTTGCFATSQVFFENVSHAAWKSFTNHGRLVLKEPSSELKIDFGNYSFQERLKLIHFFREALAGRDQQDCEKFESRCMPPEIDYKDLRSQLSGHLRFAAITFVAAIPLMYGILIWLKLNDGLPNGNWLIVASRPVALGGALLSLMWLAARGDLARARDRNKSG